VINRQRKKRLNLRACQAFAAAAAVRVAMRDSKIRLPEEIEVFLVSDASIRRIHRDFLAIDEATDVITFHHGEIFVSVETAEHQAQEFSTSFLEEIHLYIVHGLLHLAGFDDKTKRGRKRMATMQQKIVDESERALQLEGCGLAQSFQALLKKKGTKNPDADKDPGFSQPTFSTPAAGREGRRG
jgi:probable rRNA maturation factor